ncbi:hypothetical protein P154DRAFT_521034 [Amniculicola lignicola CBS 123094]|uniref:Uncharacterized protein n=1 Tax=Amniculicola lignicola CBS 123094 TaxID=1392246 RepID=A0A6A5WKV3_9PLEO|nr:hypothetical protein P154DRAFT_521034 [Amniculicola lignicola CBS 123094]
MLGLRREDTPSASLPSAILTVMICTISSARPLESTAWNGCIAERSWLCTSTYVYADNVHTTSTQNFGRFPKRCIPVLCALRNHSSHSSSRTDAPAYR